ncbi:mycothiol synthase [Rarobacter incanus]|uniref:Mycothiol acetyltransferase n=1 Tax=Rarobacter incanus TaxID=153494 RepID=A0A542SQK4_9MICO|nr:mycothiol synthase [Rarobacter incanus]TQK76901.1 mycothiol synthase [Rarobacter incanus]
MTVSLDIANGSAALADAIKPLLERVVAADGIVPLSEQARIELTRNIPTITHVTVSEDASVVGYAQINRAGGRPAAELFVDPSVRRQGIGRILLRTALRDATLPSHSGEPGANAPLRVWAHGNLPGARQLAEGEDMHVVRELDLMERPLGSEEDPSATVELPWIPSVATTLATFGPNCLVQNFVAERDERAWLDLNARAFNDHPEQGQWTLADLRARMAESWFDANGFFVVRGRNDADGTDIDEVGPLLASVWTKVEPDALATGEIYVLAVDPSAQRRGWGKRLTMLALASLRDRAITTATLWTDANNTPAVTTYQRAGFAVTRTDVQYARPK